MFGLEGSGFLLSIAFTLLLTGSVVFFMNAKLKSLQTALVQQASILGNLLQTQNWGGIGGATPQALDAAREVIAGSSGSEATESPATRMDVSDDSCSDVSSESECGDGQCPVTFLGGEDVQFIADVAQIATQGEGAVESGVKTITLSDVEDLSAINVDSVDTKVNEVASIISVTGLAVALQDNTTYLTSMKVGDLRALADELLEDGAPKKAKKADIVDMLQKATEAMANGATDLGKV